MKQRTTLLLVTLLYAGIALGVIRYAMKVLR
jgi:hypothetical protein